MTENPAHCLQILRMSLEVKFGGELPEQMRVHPDPRLAQHELRDLAGKGLGVPSPAAIAWEQPWCRGGGHPGLVVFDIQRQEFGTLFWQRQFVRLSVFDLSAGNDKVHHRRGAKAGGYEMALMFEEGKVLDPHRSNDQQFDGQSEGDVPGITPPSLVIPLHPLKHAGREGEQGIDIALVIKLPEKAAVLLRHAVLLGRKAPGEVLNCLELGTGWLDPVPGDIPQEDGLVVKPFGFLFARAVPEETERQFSICRGYQYGEAGDLFCQVA